MSEDRQAVYFPLFAQASTPGLIRFLDAQTVLLFLLQLACLLMVARVLGEVARRFSYPRVIGELAAGVLLGPSVLGMLAPSLQEALFPPRQSQYDLLAGVAWLGVLALLIVTGLETDVALIVRRGRTALCTEEPTGSPSCSKTRWSAPRSWAARRRA